MPEREHPLSNYIDRVKRRNTEKKNGLGEEIELENIEVGEQPETPAKNVELEKKVKEFVQETESREQSKGDEAPSSALKVLEFKGERPFRDKLLVENLSNLDILKLHLRQNPHKELQSYLEITGIPFSKISNQERKKENITGYHLRLRQYANPNALTELREYCQQLAKEHGIHVVLTPKPGDSYHLAIYSTLPYKNKEEKDLNTRFQQLEREILEHISKKNILGGVRSPPTYQLKQLLELADKLGRKKITIHHDYNWWRYTKKSSGSWKKEYENTEPDIY